MELKMTLKFNREKERCERDLDTMIDLINN